MTNVDAKNALMETSDSKASMLAAFARIDADPAGETLIDSISEEDQCAVEGPDSWVIEVGSDSNSADELDDVDKAIVKVA